MKLGIKMAFRFLTLTLTSLTFSGCVVSVGSRVNSTPPASPPEVIVADAGQAATIAEIDAAAQLNIDSARTHNFVMIAERSNLDPAIQVHLINKTYHCLSFESSKVLVLQKVIARPDFCDSTRHAIVKQLNKLSFDSNRQVILNQINDRMKKVAAKQD